MPIRIRVEGSLHNREPLCTKCTYYKETIFEGSEERTCHFNYECPMRLNTLAITCNKYEAEGFKEEAIAKNFSSAYVLVMVPSDKDKEEDKETGFISRREMKRRRIGQANKMTFLSPEDRLEKFGTLDPFDERLG